MAEIFQFKPKAILTAAENLEAFIVKCRDELTVFGSNLNWEDPGWPNITVFAKLGVITRKPKPQEVQDPVFIDFAKAFSVTSRDMRQLGLRMKVKPCERLRRLYFK
ncbi:Uncharacterized protein conserved in bacteria [Cedecea lapagei]|uniref:Uncharacterized protein conserved in bacteria n=1 Tax=Cedecea lapagei TaxID=158823 RepID=A0A3S4IH49_9ENTR|nr:hypothetical protein [Cedecea lapagei]VEC01533.1 Uncharacterized protein conserved in bacteria [Cedecea lapagei]